MSNLINSKIICLATSSRGGSKLFHSLLENHPDIICFPRTFRMTVFLKSINYELDNCGIIAEKFIESYPRFFNGKIWSKFNSLDKADKLGVDSNESFYVDEDEFLKHFRSLYNTTQKNTKNLFLCLHYAFHKAKGLQFSDSPFILYHYHDIQFLDDLNLCVSDFGIGNVNVIVTSRHPIDGLNSTFKSYLFQNILSTPNIYYEELSIFTNKISQMFPNINLRVVPLEIIKSYRESVMDNLCQWLNMNWHETLIDSTLMGKRWLGNAQENKSDISYKFSWFYPIGIIEKKDTKIFNTLFPHRMKIFGNSFPKKINYNFWLIILILLPMKHEIEVFKKSISPFFWIKLLRQVFKDVNSTKYIYKEKIRGQFNKFEYIYMVLKTGNILRCFLLYFRRIRFTYSLLKIDFSNEKNQLLFDPMNNKNEIS
jgi:hypothetical protein